jgi:hypothetical protein
VFAANNAHKNNGKKPNPSTGPVSAVAALSKMQMQMMPFEQITLAVQIASFVGWPVIQES